MWFLKYIFQNVVLFLNCFIQNSNARRISTLFSTVVTLKIGVKGEGFGLNVECLYMASNDYHPVVLDRTIYSSALSSTKSFHTIVLNAVLSYIELFPPNSN